MKTLVYTTKDRESFFSFLEKIKGLEVSFILIFAPFDVLDENFCRRIEKYVSTDYVAVSSNAVLNGSEFSEECIQGIFFIFERRGEVNIEFKENISLNFEIAKTFLKERLGNTNTNIIFSTASNVALNIILDDILLEDDISLFGGIASSKHPEFSTKIIYNSIFINDGFVLIQLKNIKSLVNVSTGFIPVGPAYKITKSNLNKIYEIDGVDIQFFLEKILKGTGLSPEDLDMETTSKYLWNFPFAVVDKNFGQVSYFRTPKRYSKKENALKLWGNVKTRELVKISIGDPDDIIEGTELDTKVFKFQLMETDKKPELIMNFSCVARYELLKKSNLKDEEAKIFKRMFRTSVLSGMLTFGEIAPDKSGKKVNFHNQTSILVAMWEI